MVRLTGAETRTLFEHVRDDVIKAQELEPNEKRYVSGYIRFEIKKLTEIYEGIKKNDPDYKIENILPYNDLIRVKEKIEVKLGRKPTKIIRGLKLPDILKTGLNAEEVRGYYKNIDSTMKYLSVFLMVLELKGYFRDVENKELEEVGRNEFMPGFNFRRDNKPSKAVAESKIFRHIPYIE